MFLACTINLNFCFHNYRERIPEEQLQPDEGREDLGQAEGDVGVVVRVGILVLPPLQALLDPGDGGEVLHHVGQRLPGLGLDLLAGLAHVGLVQTRQLVVRRHAVVVLGGRGERKYVVAQQART